MEVFLFGFSSMTRRMFSYILHSNSTWDGDEASRTCIMGE